MELKRTTTLPRVPHTRRALKSVIENHSHSHGVNPDGDIICIPCMAELLFDIHEMVMKDASRTADGRVVFT